MPHPRAHQLVDPHFALPLLGDWPPPAWVVESIAWPALVGIGTRISTTHADGPGPG